MAVYIIVGIVAYLIGSISFSVIISKRVAGFDVREKGSGNAGATNMLRSVGKKAAALTLLYPGLTLINHTNYTISEGSSYLVYSIILALIVAFNHRSNIRRILNGTENKLSFKK